MLNNIRFLVKNLVFRLRGDHTTEKLIKNGLQVGENFNRMVGVIIDPSHCHHITIGDNVTLAPRVHILAHDASLKTFIGYSRIGNVVIGNRVFIGADSVVMPGVMIGDDVIIGANSTITKSIPSGSVVVGSPARIICSTEELIQKHRNLMSNRPIYNSSYSFRNNPSDEMKKQMRTDLSDMLPGYIE